MYAVVFEPFQTEGLEYVRKGCGSMWTEESPIKVFETRALAQEEAKKWNTGEVVKLSPHEALQFADKSDDKFDEPDFKME